MTLKPTLYYKVSFCWFWWWYLDNMVSWHVGRRTMPIDAWLRNYNSEVLSDSQTGSQLPCCWLCWWWCCQDRWCVGRRTMPIDGWLRCITARRYLIVGQEATVPVVVIPRLSMRQGREHLTVISCGQASRRCHCPATNTPPVLTD